MRLKDRFPTETALTEMISVHAAAITARVKEAVGALEDEYIRSRRNQKIGLALIIGTLIVPKTLISLLPFRFDRSLSIVLFISIMLLGIFSGFKYAFSGSELIQRFHQVTKKVVFGEVFSLLGIKGVLVEQSLLVVTTPNTSPTLFNFLKKPQSSPQEQVVFERLAQSELITLPFNTIKVDNCFELTIAGALVQGSELDVQQITSSGKSRDVRNIFKGYFLSCNLNRTLEGKTFVSTEGDKYGFAHRTFWGGDVVETTLEWNQFEALLHVATNNEVEARYILTTNFMNDLYDWWHTKSNNIRISFIGNYMYLLFPDQKFRFNTTVSKITETEVEEYMLTIATPLLHVVHLIEDVRL